MKKIKELAKLLVALDSVNLDLLDQLIDELKTNPENVLEYIKHESDSHWNLLDIMEHNDFVYKDPTEIADLAPTDLESYCNIDKNKTVAVIERLKTISELLFKK